MKKPLVRQMTRLKDKRDAKESEDRKSKHILFGGNRRIIRASREAMGAIKYKAE